MKLKKCPKCGQILSENMFAPNTKYCRLCRRDYDWQYKYGLSPEQYYEIYTSQGGKCKICGKEAADGGCLHVDHDKATGEIRGLLCRECNLGIGNFKDNPENLINAAKYLKGE